MEFAAYVGLDWADQKHAVCLESGDGSVVEEFELEQKPDTVHAWVAQLRRRFDGRSVAIAIEQARGALIHALMMYEFIVLYPINPKALAKYREALAVSGSKDDPSDARLLKDFFKNHRQHLRAWIPGDVQTRTIQILSEHRRNAVEDRVRLMHRIESLLKAYFPQALDWAGGLHTVQACDFLMQWPTLAAVQKVRPATLRKFYYSHRCRRRELIDERIAQVGQARPLTEDPAIMFGLSMAMKAAVAQLRPLIDVIDEFDRKQAELFAQHPDCEIFQSLPGAGAVFAPRLMAVMGADRGRFDEASEVQRSSGIAPVTVKSGKSCWVHHRWACPKFVKQTFHEFAELSIPYSSWARACYKRLRDRGKGHHAAVRALAYKWIRVIFRCWKERKPYDESQYIETLRRRGSPIVEFLC
jgi:hypothetical protein